MPPAAGGCSLPVSEHHHGQHPNLSFLITKDITGHLLMQITLSDSHLSLKRASAAMAELSNLSGSQYGFVRQKQKASSPAHLPWIT